jgi:hypothetical protein
MADTAVEPGPRLIAFVLPSIPESVRIARFHVRAALGLHGLGEYADDAQTITSELVSDAVQRCLLTGAGASKTAEKQSSRYSPRRHDPP